MGDRKVTMEEVEKGNKQVRPGMSESFSQAGAVVNPSRSDHGPMEDNNPAIIGGSNDGPGMSESFSQAGAVVNPSRSDHGPMEDNNPAIIGGSNDGPGMSESFCQAGAVVNPSRSDHGPMEDNNPAIIGGSNDGPGMSESFSQAGAVVNPSRSDHGPMEDNNPAIIGGSNDCPGMSESFSQAGAVVNPSRSDHGPMEDNNPAIDRGFWRFLDDDDDNDAVVDIHTLLSEYGGFGDFFETDELPFGEPPGTAESQALPFATQDCADIGSSPGTEIMNASDPVLLQDAGFSSIDSFNQLPPPATATIDDSLAKDQELTKDNAASAPRNSEFDQAEALTTFAPEYEAIDTSCSTEISSSILRSPYIPNSLKEESENSSSDSNYIHSATPPAIDDSVNKSNPKVALRVYSRRSKPR